MSYINFIQYNLPFTQEQDETMRELGLTDWQGLNSFSNSANLENNPILISHLGFWAAEDCEIQIKGFEYKDNNWQPEEHYIQVGMGNKIELDNVRLFSVGVSSNNSGEYWGNNAKLDMAIADFETLERIENKEIVDTVPAYWTEILT